MIEIMYASILICDETGIPFYTREFGMPEAQEEFDLTVLSGLIFAIGKVGAAMFSKDIGSIVYGDNDAKIIVVTKDMFQIGKRIEFVYCGSYDFSIKDFPKTFFIFSSGVSVLEFVSILERCSYIHSFFHLI